jgi:hypothetical protein
MKRKIIYIKMILHHIFIYNAFLKIFWNILSPTTIRNIMDKDYALIDQYNKIVDAEYTWLNGRLYKIK